jgi:hypothetical protein
MKELRILKKLGINIVPKKKDFYSYIKNREKGLYISRFNSLCYVAGVSYGHGIKIKIYHGKNAFNRAKEFLTCYT